MVLGGGRTGDTLLNVVSLVASRASPALLPPLWPGLHLHLSVQRYQVIGATALLPSTLPSSLSCCFKLLSGSVLLSPLGGRVSLLLCLADVCQPVGVPSSFRKLPLLTPGGLPHTWGPLWRSLSSGSSPR